MCELPPISIDFGRWQVNLLLSCNPLELLRIFAQQTARSLDMNSSSTSLESGVSCTGEELARCVVRSPELLVFAAAHFIREEGLPIPTFDHLIDWLIVRGSQTIVDRIETASEECLAQNLNPDNPRAVTLELFARSPKLAAKKRYLETRQTRTGKKFRKILATLLSKPVDRFLFRQVVDHLFNQACVAPLETSQRFFAWKRQTRLKFREDSPPNTYIILNDTGKDCSGTLLEKNDFLFLIKNLRRAEELATEFNQRLQAEKMAALKQLAYGASHEINNPLANISTRAQVLLVDESIPERRSKLAAIYEQALRAHEMISDLMLFANPPAIQTGIFRLRPWLASLNLQILQSYFDALPQPHRPPAVTVSTNGHCPSTDVVGYSETDRSDYFSGETARSQPSFQITIAPGIDTIYGDPLQLAIAVKALVRNAYESIQNSKCQGEISLRIDKGVADQILISVSDNGPGVSQATARHLFDPFFSGREAGRGLGFGLSKAWRIAELHRGRVNWNSIPGQLTSFTLVIPAAENDAAVL